MNFSMKYWAHHKKRAATLLGVIMVSTMAMTVGMLLARSASQGSVEKALYASGEYELAANPVGKSQLEVLSESGQVAQYGVILNGGVCKTKYSDAVFFGAFDSDASQRMFHYTPEKGGRYPKASGEICGYKDTFRRLGVAPYIGSRLTLELYNAEGAQIGEKEFTVTGVLDEADSLYGVKRSMADAYSEEKGVFAEAGEKWDFPELFISREDLPDSCTMTALIRCAADAVPSETARALADRGIPVWTPNPDMLSALSTIAMVDYETENDLYSRAHLSYNDFYASILIPAFLGITILASFISVYVVMADAMKERQKQFGLYRSMGMSMGEVRRRLFMEGFFFDFTGVAAGYAAGIFIYVIYLQAVNAVSDVSVCSAFCVHRIAGAVSLNPFVYPWLLGLVFSAAALGVSMLRFLRLSPNEMLAPEKTAALSGRHKRRFRRRRALGRITGRKLSGNRAVSLLIFLTGWSFVFGAAFMMGKADSDNWLFYPKLDDAEEADADYVARKDIEQTMCGDVTFNRHGEGISADDLSALAASGDVDSVRGVIKLPGLKVYGSGGNLSAAQQEALAPLNIENDWQDYLVEMEEKSKIALGYAASDRLYGLPCVAVDSGFMTERLSKYVVSGGLDMKGMAEGKKVAIVEYPDAEMDSPFSIGDMVSLTDSVIHDPYIEDFDFSESNAPEGYEPAFYYDYKGDYEGEEMKHIAGYAFGEKVVFDAQVCAVLHVDDEKLKNLMYSESYVWSDASYSHRISPGYGILCITDALPGWGLPDRCYTDVQVNLKPDADVERFERQWYTVIGNSGAVKSISRMDVRQSIAQTDRMNMILFASMILLVIFTGCFGMVSAYYFAVNKNMGNLQVLRAVGISRRALVFCHVRELLLWPLWAVVTSLLPIAVFDMVKRYAYYYAFTLGHNAVFSADNGKLIQNWSTRFPWYIELWKQPIALIMAVAFLIITLLNIAAAAMPLVHMQKADIITGIRTDDF